MLWTCVLSPEAESHGSIFDMPLIDGSMGTQREKPVPSARSRAAEDQHPKSLRQTCLSLTDEAYDTPEG